MSTNFHDKNLKISTQSLSKDYKPFTTQIFQNNPLTIIQIMLFWRMPKLSQKLTKAYIVNAKTIWYRRIS